MIYKKYADNDIILLKILEINKKNEKIAVFNPEIPLEIPV